MDEVVPPVFARFREGLRSGNCMRDGARRGNFIPSISLPFYFGRPYRSFQECSPGAPTDAPVRARPTEGVLSLVTLNYHVICTRSLAGPN